MLLRLPEAQRERVEQMRNLPVAFAKDGTPITLDAVADIEPVVNPEVIRRQNLQRREAIFAGVQGPAGGRRRRRRAEAGQGDARCRRASASTSAARRSEQEEAFSGHARRRWRWR